MILITSSIKSKLKKEYKMKNLFPFFYFSLLLIILSINLYGGEFPDFPAVNTFSKSVSNQQVSGWINASRGFEPNNGQLTSFEGKRVDEILFSVKERGFTLYFKTSGVSYVIYRKEGETGLLSQKQPGDKHPGENSKIEYARIDLELLNSDIDKSKIVYEEPLPGYTNYYLSQCPEGILNVVSYRKITVKDVYPGIDWVFRYDERGELHHEFAVGAGVDVKQIKFKVRWADVELGGNGREILFSTPLGEIKDGSIVSYSGINTPDVRYRIEEGGIVRYEVSGWDGREKLIIDPPLALLWGTYYGGSGTDYSNSITTDNTGNVFVTGWTASTNFPVYNPGGGAYFQGTYGGGSYDVFILKFSNTGNRLWATYYGGNNYDYGYSITTDASGNVFVTGKTYSSDFPLYNPGGGAYFQGTNAGGDAFILKFSNTGSRLWATYYGGSSGDVGYSITTDSSGNVFVTGYTESTNFPVYNPGGGAYFQGTHSGNGDAFILKFSNTGSRLWATYYGGSDYDEGYSITTDASSNVFVTGYAGTNFPVYNPGGGAYYQGTYGGGSSDAFILKFNNSGVSLWATYYGGSGNDKGYSVTTDASGNVFVTGWTSSTNFPVYNPGSAYFQGTGGGNYDDAFILKFSNTGSRLWATYYGGSNDDWGWSLTTDASGSVFVTGETKSTSFPVFNPGGGAYFQTIAGSYDAFILKFSNAGVRLWATCYGGSSGDYGYSITTDVSGNVFVTGETNSTNFPVYNPGDSAYFQGTNAGGYDAFILKFEGVPTGVNPIGIKIPSSFALSQNYPNPFNPVTNIEFDVPKSTQVRLVVYDIMGREVAVLVNEMLSAGSYRVRFDGSSLSSGIYFYRLISGEYTRTNKMLLIK